MFYFFKFSKSFSLNKLKKGFSPHLFNKPENQNYIGAIPDKKFFGLNYFSESKKIKFEKWYDNNKHKLYNIKDEIYSYFLSDVKLLKEGCLAFRQRQEK